MASILEARTNRCLSFKPDRESSVTSFRNFTREKKTVLYRLKLNR